MARQERTKSPRRPPHPAWQWVRRGAPPIVKTAGVIVAVVALVGVWLTAYVERSPYFWVSTIDIRLEPGQHWVSDPRIGYRVNPPVHIFRADLWALAASIRREHPQFENVVVRRDLPNRLTAQVALREPVGQLRGRQYYLLGADGMVLAPGSSTAWEGLPVFLFGLRTAAYQPGQVCAVPELRQAVAVLREMRRARALGSHRVSAVRVEYASVSSATASVVTLVLDNGLELRTTPGGLTPHLAKLAELLNGKGRELDQAQYVDLRFDDLVVGLKGDE